MSPRSIKIRRQASRADTLSTCNKITKALWKEGVSITPHKKEDFIMQTGMKILKLVGKAAANAVIWIAVRLERRK